jgi:hypothetical protein
MVSFAAFFSPKHHPLLSDLQPIHEPMHGITGISQVGGCSPGMDLRQPTHGFAKLLSIFRREGVKDLNQFLYL